MAHRHRNKVTILQNLPSVMPTQQFSHKRLKNEFKAITAMLQIYCKAHHSHSDNKKILCQECKELQCYAKKRLNHCPFQENKPTCGNCEIHCYKKSMRYRIQAVMRYAGPRMIYRHPIMAIKHLIDSRRNSPVLQKNDQQLP